MAIKKDLRNLNRRRKKLEQMGGGAGGGLSDPLVQAGIKVIDLLSMNWDVSKGGDDRSLKPLSPGYARYKRDKRNKTPAANMQLSGDMRRSLVAKKRGRFGVVTFRGTDNLNKARGNFDKRPNFFKVGPRIRKAVTDFMAIFLGK